MPFAAALAESRATALERKDAVAALLPSAIYHNLALYTEPNGVPTSRIGQTTDAPSPVFIANNAVREYASQGVFNETVGLAQIGALRLADARAAQARAELEIARRGLVATVVNLYFAVQAGAEKQAIATQGLTEADQFVSLTEKREAAREVAHADVLKARLEQQGRERELADARLEAVKAKIELGVLLFPVPTMDFDLAPPGALPVLPERAAVELAGKTNNPELRSALAAVQIAAAETYTAQAALLPELSTNFTYGIDATNFGVNGPDGIHNLGYSFSATLDLPVWDWLTTERKVKESRLRGQAVAAALTAAQRRLLGDLAEFYAEAQTAQTLLASLDQSVADGRESARLTALRYAVGESSALEVVDAQNALLTTENARADGAVRLRTALAQLQTLTGTLP